MPCTSPFDICRVLHAMYFMHATPLMVAALGHLKRHARRLRRLIFPLKIFQCHAKVAQRHVFYFPESCRKIHLAWKDLWGRNPTVYNKKIWITPQLWICCIAENNCFIICIAWDSLQFPVSTIRPNKSPPLQNSVIIKNSYFLSKVSIRVKIFGWLPTCFNISTLE